MSTGATLVLVSYNHAKFVAQALESYANQTYDNLRLIVMDDASADDSVTVITATLNNLNLDAVTVFHDTNRGICATFNEGLSLVQTPLVAFLAADDWMVPERFERQAAMLDSNPSAVMAYSDMILVDEEGAELPGRYSKYWPETRPVRDPFPALVVGNWIPAPSVLARTDAMRDAGGYDERLTIEDYDMWLRLTKGREVAESNEPLVRYRVLSSSLSRNVNRLESCRMEALALGKHLDSGSPHVVPRAFHNAVEAYKLGDRSPEIRRVLRRAAARGSARSWVWPVLSALRVPLPTDRRGTPM